MQLSVLIISLTSTLSCELPSNNKRLLVISSQWLLYGHPTCKERLKICYNVLVHDMLMRHLTQVHISFFTVQRFPKSTNLLQLCEKWLFIQSNCSQITWHMYTRLPSTHVNCVNFKHTNKCKRSQFVSHVTLTQQHQLQQSHVARCTDCGVCRL